MICPFLPILPPMCVAIPGSLGGVGACSRGGPPSYGELRYSDVTSSLGIGGSGEFTAEFVESEKALAATGLGGGSGAVEYIYFLYK